jgi:hypothetical protein
MNFATVGVSKISVPLDPVDVSLVSTGSAAELSDTVAERF